MTPSLPYPLPQPLLGKTTFANCQSMPLRRKGNDCLVNNSSSRRNCVEVSGCPTLAFYVASSAADITQTCSYKLAERRRCCAVKRSSLYFLALRSFFFIDVYAYCAGNCLALCSPVAEDPSGPYVERVIFCRQKHKRCFFSLPLTSCVRCCRTVHGNVKLSCTARVCVYTKFHRFPRSSCTTSISLLVACLRLLFLVGSSKQQQQQQRPFCAPHPGALKFVKTAEMVTTEGDAHSSSSENDSIISGDGSCSSTAASTRAAVSCSFVLLSRQQGVGLNIQYRRSR